MVRVRASTKQGLGGPYRRRRTATGWLLDGHETFPLQALEHRERRRQWFTVLAVMPAPVRDRYLDEGGQELGRRPLGGHQRLPGLQKGETVASPELESL